MKIIQTLFYLLICQFGNSQIFSVKWGTEFRLTSGIFENNIYLKSIPTGKGGAISVFVKKESFKVNNDFIIAKINNKAQIESHIELPFVNNLKEGFLDIVKLQNSFFILKYRYISDEKAQLVVNRLDVDKFAIEKEEKLIGELEASEKRGSLSVFAGGSLYLFNASVHYSPDSSKLVIVNDPFQKRKSTKKINLHVLNNDLSKAHVKEFNFSTASNKTLVRSTSITNEGKVVVLYNVYEKDYEMMFYGNGDKVPIYTSHMLIIDETKKNNVAINISNKFLQSAHVGYNESGSPILIGFYKDKHNGRLSGAIRANINVNTEQSDIISNIKLKPFDEDILKKVDRDNQGQKDGSNPGLDNDFFVNQLLCVDNGFNSIVLEYYNTISHSNGALETIKGNLIVSSFLTDGDIIFQLIPRKQKTPNQAGSSNLLGSGFYTMDYFKDKIILFYNDKDDNILKGIEESPEKFGEERNSALVVAALSLNGKLNTRKIVYSHEGMDGFVTNLNFTKINDNTYLVYAIKAGALKHALKAGIMTMK